MSYNAAGETEMLLVDGRQASLRWVWALVLLALAGNVVGWLGLGLMPEEAYYWGWSQRLELSYYDHPPLIAWLMWPLTTVLGSATWVVRLPAVLSWLVGAVLGYKMAQRIYGGYAGALAVLVWSSLPIVQAGFHIVTPDSPLIIFTWLTLWFAWRAVSESQPRLWLWTGVMAGLAMLGKYPGVLVVGSVFFALLSTQEGRAQLKTPWPWLATIISVIVFLPVIVWNVQHDWLSFAFQLGHGIKAKAQNELTVLLSAFVGGQVLVAMPWTLLAIVLASISRGKHEPRASSYTHALLAWGFFLPMFVFGLAGLTDISSPNWPETAYASGAILLGGALNRWLVGGDAWRTARVITLSMLFLFTVILMNMIRFPQWISYFVADDYRATHATQLSQSYGWDKVRVELASQLKEMPGDCRVLVDNHTRAAMVGWLLGNALRVDTTQATRFSQYNVWRTTSTKDNDYCLYLQLFDNEMISKDHIPQSVELPEGQFSLAELVTADNPDRSLRWFGLYRSVK
jgi:4-amino-4-deoxy-L-arabinose transferase-like glycosyltransferase